VANKRITYLHAFLASLDGSNIAGNTASNDDQVLFIWDCRSVADIFLQEHVCMRVGANEPEEDAKPRLHRVSVVAAYTVGSLEGRSEES
jgi:hypothetical protein